jgi:hypothetical protein
VHAGRVERPVAGLDEADGSQHRPVQLRAVLAGRSHVQVEVVRRDLGLGGIARSVTAGRVRGCDHEQDRQGDEAGEAEERDGDEVLHAVSSEGRVVHEPPTIDTQHDDVDELDLLLRAAVGRRVAGDIGRGAPDQAPGPLSELAPVGWWSSAPAAGIPR